MANISDQPQIEPMWVIAMLFCGAVGVAIHLLIIFKMIPHLRSNPAVKGKGIVWISGCMIIFVLNGVACAIWLLFRTNLVINLTIASCQFIYVSNFVCYFVAKYVLHCLLIGRIYLTFVNTPYRMHLMTFALFVSVLSLHFLVSTSIWVYEVTPHILKGTWMQYEICTLFSNEVRQTSLVKACAISIGVEDFVVGSMTMYILLKRLRVIVGGTHDYDLSLKSIRYGIVGGTAMISTLFLFTLAIPFWPNVTFIIAIDAVVNSLCIFCVLTIGHRTYYYLCFPFRILFESEYIKQNDTQISNSNIVMIIHKQLTPIPPEKKHESTFGLNNATVATAVDTNISKENFAAVASLLFATAPKTAKTNKLALRKSMSAMKKRVNKYSPVQDMNAPSSNLKLSVSSSAPVPKRI